MDFVHPNVAPSNPYPLLVFAATLCHLQIYLADLGTSMEALKVNDTLFKGEHSTDEILKYYNEWAETGKYDEVRYIIWGN